MALLVKYQPFKTKKQNIVAVLAEVFFFLAHCILFLFPIFEKTLTPDRVKQLSWSSIGVFTLSFLMNLMSKILKKKKPKKDDKDEESGEEGDEGKTKKEIIAAKVDSDEEDDKKLINVKSI